MPDPTTPAPIPTYTPLSRALLEGFFWGIGLLALYALVDYAADGKLDLRRLRR